MLNDEICTLREKLNESLLKEADYAITYELSIQLDELIARFYRQKIRVN